MTAQQAACERAVRLHQLREAAPPLDVQLLIEKGSIEPPPARRAGSIRRFCSALLAWLAAPCCDLT